MSASTNISNSNHDDHHHHKETFITKYIFSQDHKMIAKQYLILGVLFMGFIGVAMSLLFRLQLAWPEQSFADCPYPVWGQITLSRRMRPGLRQ